MRGRRTVRDAEEAVIAGEQRDVQPSRLIVVGLPQYEPKQGRDAESVVKAVSSLKEHSPIQSSGGGRCDGGTKLPFELITHFRPFGSLFGRAKSLPYTIDRLVG